MWMRSNKTDNNSNPTEVKVIRITPFEEIIAECQLDSDGIFIKDGAHIISMGQGKLVLGTWMPHTTVQEGFFLPNKAFIFVADPEKEMLNYYNKWRTDPFAKEQSQPHFEDNYVKDI